MLPFALIPRAIFPWKPEAEAGKIFSLGVFGGVSSVSPFPIGEGYLNGGFLGVLLLMAVFGLLQKAFYVALYPGREGGPLMTGIYTYLFLTITSIDSSLITSYIGVLQKAAVLAAICFFFLRPPKPARASEG